MFLISLIMIVLSCLSGCYQHGSQHLTVKGYNHGCLCPGDTVTYECTVVGGSNIVWKGTAFTCPSTNNEIVLPLSMSANKTCNESISAKVLGQNGNESTAQLNVTLTREVIGKSVECFLDTGEGEAGSEVEIGSLNVTDGLIITPSYTEGISISHDITACQESKIVVNWSPFITNCSILHYSISSSNCGSCPTTSTHTNITCTNAPMNGGVCTVSVSAVVWGNVTSEPLTWKSIVNSSCPDIDKDTRITSIFVIIICVLAVVFMAFCMSLIALRNQVKNRCCSMHTHPEENVMKKSSDSLKEKVEDTELTPNVAYCYVTKRPAMAAM